MTHEQMEIARLTQERDEARAEVEQMHARTDHATAELLALGRELRQARDENVRLMEERDQSYERGDSLSKNLTDAILALHSAEAERDRAVAEAAGVREVLIDVWHRFNQHVRPATSLTERVEKSLDHTLATQAAAVLAAVADWSHDVDRRTAFDSALKLLDANDAYQKALKGD